MPVVEPEKIEEMWNKTTYFHVTAEWELPFENTRFSRRTCSGRQKVLCISQLIYTTVIQFADIPRIYTSRIWHKLFEYTPQKEDYREITDIDIRQYMYNLKQS